MSCVNLSQKDIKIRGDWSVCNRSWYITRNEFRYRARYELERILTQPDYIPVGYSTGIYGDYPPDFPLLLFLLRFMVLMDMVIYNIKNYKII